MRLQTTLATIRHLSGALSYLKVDPTIGQEGTIPSGITALIREWAED